MVGNESSKTWVQRARENPPQIRLPARFKMTMGAGGLLQFVALCSSNFDWSLCKCNWSSGNPAQNREDEFLRFMRKSRNLSPKQARIYIENLTRCNISCNANTECGMLRDFVRSRCHYLYHQAQKGRRLAV